MDNRVALVIPYYGKKPPYFDLWLKSAHYNTDFDFLIFSDIDFGVSEIGNVKQFNISFSQLKKKIENMLSMKIKLNNPYKLCDYKPTYGLVFEEYLKEYDFWGFVDVDLILGDLSKYITDELLDKYDKLYYEGHFSLFRNTEAMNTLFLKRYPHVMDYRFAFSTNYSCHFDENGTVVWAHEVDKNSGIRFYTDWSFFDVPISQYELVLGGKQGYVRWCNGQLIFHTYDGTFSQELMYIHLQKRKMQGISRTEENSFAIARNRFYSICENEYLSIDIDRANEKKYAAQFKQKRNQERIKNIWNGALRSRVYSVVCSWKRR